MVSFSFDENGSFDFSLDAELFRVRLLKHLLSKAAPKAVEPISDEALEWVNAAGTGTFASEPVKDELF